MKEHLILAMLVLFRARTHKSRLFGNRWLPQTTCADYAGSSGRLPPPSPPAEKAKAVLRSCALMTDRPIPAANSWRTPPSRPRASPRTRTAWLRTKSATSFLCGRALLSEALFVVKTFQFELFGKHLI